MPRFSSSARAALAGVACVLVARVAPAADEDAEALIRRGVGLRREHRDAEALAVFQEAYALQPSPRARAQIALAEQSVGRWVAAEADLQAAMAADDPWIARNREPLERALAVVAAHLAWLTVTSNAPAARVALGGAPLATLPMAAPVRIVAGEASLRVEADGYLPAEQAIRVEPSESARVSIDLSSVPAPVARAAIEPPIPPRPAAPSATAGGPAAPAVSAPAAGDPPVPWAGIVLGAIGVAGVTAGAVFGVQVFDDKAQRDPHCAAGRCDATGMDYDDRARRAATMSTIGFGLGAAGLVAGAWVYGYGTRRLQPVGVVPAATSTSAGLSAVGIW
jgi:hypothetical protein